MTSKRFWRAKKTGLWCYSYLPEAIADVPAPAEAFGCFHKTLGHSSTLPVQKRENPSRHPFIGKTQPLQMTLYFS